MEQVFNTPYFNPNRQPNQNWMPTYQNTYNKPVDFNQLTKYGTPKVQFNTGGGSVPASSGGSGVNVEGLVQGATGAIDLGIDIASMDDEAKAIQTKAPTGQTDAFGKPMYNLAGYNTYAGNIKPRGASGGEVLSGVGKGAMAGAQLGSAIPVVGTAIGAAVGGLIGGVGKLFGGRKRKREMERRKKKALKSLSQRQKKYNRETLAYAQQRQAMQTYYDQVNNTNRMYNLYGDTD